MTHEPPAAGPSRRRPLAWAALSLLLVAADRPGPPLAVRGLTVEQAVALAVERNERAAITTLEEEAATARVSRARAYFFPELAVTGTYTRRLHETVRTVGGSQVVVSRHNALAAQANVGMTLFDARFFPTYRQVLREREAAALAGAESRRLLGYEAADAFLMVLGLEQVAQAARRRAEFAEVTRRDARARAEAGLASRNDVTRAELELSTANREIVRAQSTAEESRLALGLLLDARLEGALVVPQALLAEAGRPSAPAQAQADAALGRRLDLAAGARRVQALEAWSSEPLLRMVPALGLVAQYRMTNESGLSGRSGDGFAGLVATWSLFDGGERFAERRERIALAQAEAFAQEARARTVRYDVERTRLLLEHARAAERLSVTAVDAARRNAAEANELYRQGLARALEVADASLRLFEAEVAAVRERYGLALAYLDLRASMGDDPPGVTIRVAGEAR